LPTARTLLRITSLRAANAARQKQIINKRIIPLRILPSSLTFIHHIDYKKKNTQISYILPNENLFSNKIK